MRAARSRGIRTLTTGLAGQQQARLARAGGPGQPAGRPAAFSGTLALRNGNLIRIETARGLPDQQQVQYPYSVALDQSRGLGRHLTREICLARWECDPHTVNLPMLRTNIVHLPPRRSSGATVDVPSSRSLPSSFA
jgi:hypothetical protein